MRRALLVAPILVLVVPVVGYAADDTVPGNATAPFPTLNNVSIEWPITGDDDEDATVTVRYREEGAASFREALPLFRVPAGSSQGIDWANRFAGSVFGLDPGTTYEFELTLADPDGGSTTSTVTATTRSMPRPSDAATEVAATPATIDDVLSSAQAGNIVVLGDGTYGEIVIPVDGTSDAPIVLRPATEGGAIVEGDVRIDGRAHVIVEGLVVHGKIKFNDAESITIRDCTIETTEDGIVSFGSGVTNAVIMDNTITGATDWYEGALGVDGDNIGEGVVLTGPGNVIAFNRVSGFRDCLSLLEDDLAVQQISIDMYGNDLSACADDGIEADFSMGNVRVYHNRIRDSFMGISSQPSLGGPTYFFRNVMYNVLFQAFKLQRSSVGDVLLHNTVVKSGDAFSVNTTDVWSRAFVRNNLFIGGPGGTYNGYDSGPGDVMTLSTAAPNCSFDYDGYGAIGVGAFHGNVGGTTFDSVSEMQSSTTEVHGLEVDLAVFAATVAFPSDPFAAPATPSIALEASGDAIDAGVELPNVNDGFSGSAPDIGALELGSSEPIYGPGGTIETGGGGSGGGDTGGGDVDGGASSMGGGAASGGGPAGGGSADGDSDSGGDGGCGCRNATSPSSGWAAIALVLLGLCGLRRARSHTA